MTRQKAINQLESLREHCETMIDFCNSDIFKKDVKALDFAIDSLKAGARSEINNMTNFEKYREASTEEKDLVENVGIARNVKFRYIARDGDGALYLYEKMPSKDGDTYTLGIGDFFNIHNSLFPWVKFESGVYDIRTSQFINVE